MRSYNQYCALARSLDVIGERWTLLIIRELFARDSRFSDLRDGLPGIATNLLAERLRRLQADGIIEAYEARRPVNATVYRLTPRGRELGPVLKALVEWGGPLIGGAQAGDTFRTHWMALGLPILFDGAETADLAPLTVLIKTGDEPATLRLGDDGITMAVGADATDGAVVLEGDPDGIIAVLTGSGDGACPAGVSISGPPQAIARLHDLASRSRIAKRSSRRRREHDQHSMPAG